MVRVFTLDRLFSLEQVSVLRVPLTGDEVHLWIADVSDPFYRDRENSRKVYKKLLADYLGVNPKEFSFLKNQNGKPFIPAAINPQQIQFNVSHSGDYLAMAFHQGGVVGVDIEKHRSEGYFKKISEKFFTDEENKYIYESLVLSTQRFFEIWSAKEAAVKTVGGSFFKDVSQVALDPINRQILKMPETPEDIASWHWYIYSGLQNYSLSVIAQI